MPRTVKSLSAISFVTGTRPRKDNGDLRPWQRDCLTKIESFKRAVILAPTGSGKSTVAMSRGAICLAQNKTLKHLVSVPQNIIANSFTKEFLENKIPGVSWPEVGKLSWGCEPCIDSSKVEALYNFITSTRTAPSMRRMVCTHQALVIVYKRLEQEGKLSALKSIMLTIDEVHHSETTDDIDNRLGEIVRYFFENDLRLDMFTATLIRANYLDIIPGEYQKDKDYAKYIRYIDEHLEEILPNGRVNIRFLIGTAEDSLAQMYKEGKKKTIVYLPPVSSHIMGQYGSKYNALDKLRKVIKGKKVVDIDLVTEQGRNSRKDTFLDCIGTSSEPDLLWALNMCKEGFDWPAAERALVIGPRGSMVDVIQMLGRLLRDYKGKTEIDFSIALPETKDPESIRAYLGFMMSSLVVEWQFRRPKLADLKSQKVAEKVFEDYPEIGKKAIEGAVLAGIKASDEMDAEEVIRNGIEGIEEIDEAEKDLLAPILKRMMNGIGDGVLESTYKPEVVAEVFGKVKAYASAFGYKSLRELREALGCVSLLTEEMILEAGEKFKKQYGKYPFVASKELVPELPNETWVIIDSALREGYRGLPGGSSLAILFGKKKDDLTVEQIKKAGEEFKKQYSKYPSGTSKKPVPGMPNENWRAINEALIKGCRGFPGGSSLAILFETKKDDLTIDQIKKTGEDYRKQYGKYPFVRSKEPVPGMPNETWGGINAALRHGCRGLPGGSSLAILFDKKKDDFTIDQIKKAGEEFKKQYGKYPFITSKELVPGLPNENWSIINDALRHGFRGLPGGSSLSKLFNK